MKNYPACKELQEDFAYMQYKVPKSHELAHIRKLSHRSIKDNFESKIVNIFFPIHLNMCFGCSKEPSH